MIGTDQVTAPEKKMKLGPFLLREKKKTLENSPAAPLFGKRAGPPLGTRAMATCSFNLIG